MATLPKAYALFETTLQDSISSSATSMTLVTGTDKEGSALSGTIGFIIDEGTASEEFVIGSVTATAVSSMLRGVSSSDGTTEVAGNKKAHRKGASIKITNHPLLIRLYRIANGDDAFPDNPQTLGDSSQMATSAAPTADADIANKKYVDDTAVAGAPDATTTVKGNVEIATDAELAAGTGTGGTGAATVATGSSFNETAAAGKVPVGDSGGKIGADWGGSASTLATLDGSAKVVEDPANATATPTASKIPIADGSGKLDDDWLSDNLIGLGYFGDGSDGDVTISGATTLTADMYYETLTIATGQELKPNGFKIFVRDTLTFEGTGKISAYGGAGQVGQAVPGLATAGTQANTAGTLPSSATAGAGGKGGENGGSGIATAGATGLASTKAIVSANGSAGGAGGTGGGAGGAGGANTGTPVNPLKTYNDVYSLIDWSDNTLARMDISAGAGGGGGGAAGSGPNYSNGGGGGGGGAAGGNVWVSAKNIVTVNGNDYIDVHGGAGGNGGTGVNQGSGGGGGAGGNGGVAIVSYYTKTGTGTINVAFGAKGTGGTGGDANGADGNDGTVGESYLIQIN